MKRFHTLFLLVFVGQSALAQTTFCPEGARWIYNSLGGGPSTPHQDHIIYVGDTTVDGHSNVRILKKEIRSVNYWSGEIEYYEDRNYIWQSGDSIFQFANGNFELMFDLGVQVGDTRVIYTGGGETCLPFDTMLIEYIDTMYYLDIPLRRFGYRILLADQMMGGPVPWNVWGNLQGHYVQKIGFLTDHPTNKFWECIGYVSEYIPANFMCYTDNELSANFPDTCNLFLRVEDELVQDKPRLKYSQETLQIQNASNSTVIIYNNLGKQLFQTTINSDNQTIDLSGLPNGVLLIVCENSEFRITKKVVRFSN